MNTHRAGRDLVRKLAKDSITWRSERATQRKDVSQALIKALLNNGMTQKEVGEFVGVSQAAISHALHRRSAFSFSGITMLFDLVDQRQIKLPERVSVWRPL